MREKVQPESMIRKSGNLLKALCIASEESGLQLQTMVCFGVLRLLFRKKGQAFFAARAYRLFGGILADERSAAG